jgi:EthD domain
MRKLMLFLIVSVTMVLPAHSQSADSPAASFTVESYYKAKWGYADEFIRLWKANHYPLLKKALGHGDIVSIKAETPRLHSGEDIRWDFRVTIVFKTAALAFDENLTAPYKKQLFPDQDAFTKAEQHRFELLLSHWDIETAEEVLP